MFTIKERCECKPLAQSGPFARPFIVEIEVNVFSMRTIRVAVFLKEEDGTERKLAAGSYEVNPDMLQNLEKELREKFGQEGGGQ